MGAPRVVAFDLSLTATGVAGWPEGRSDLITTTARQSTSERVHTIAGSLPDFMDGADLIVIEDLPRNPQRGGVQLGMVHATFWLTYDRIVCLAPVVAITPASLKKYATGKGNAPKDLMLTEAVRRLGYEGADHNEADALWLRAMALDQYGAPLCELPKAQRDALAKIHWPATIEVPV